MRECAFTGHGIQHRDGILPRNLSVFIPFTLVQQKGFFKNLHSGERFEKIRRVFGGRLHWLHVNDRRNQSGKNSVFKQKRIRVDGASVVGSWIGKNSLHAIPYKRQSDPDGKAMNK